MRLIPLENAQEVGAWVAQRIVNKINQFKPTADRPFLLGLPTGSSPLVMYQQLIKQYQAGNVSFKHVVTFNMDEYVGLPEDHPQSYHTFMYENFLKIIHKVITLLCMKISSTILILIKTTSIY
jgi:6-phosphogluconolactonase/Glucosamine-6-phosphate isomerase/deaminase